ncbi:hypothetical protein CDAR_423071 [Caerostris darwini]|uniref:Uncharacterized protein n=1 Tax=Caerostris darwini TaxID=1538125 RepID=A0AAV4TCH1_9ARAC|nr:hypothetical protein CDAR_423071 [Caerostris darwini]
MKGSASTTPLDDREVSQRRLLSTNIVLHFGTPEYATPYLELERAVFPLTAGMDPERRGVFSEQGHPLPPSPPLTKGLSCVHKNCCAAHVQVGAPSPNRREGVSFKC